MYISIWNGLHIYFFLMHQFSIQARDLAYYIKWQLLHFLSYQTKIKFNLIKKDLFFSHVSGHSTWHLFAPPPPPLITIYFFIPLLVSTTCSLVSSIMLRASLTTAVADSVAKWLFVNDSQVVNLMVIHLQWLIHWSVRRPHLQILLNIKAFIIRAHVDRTMCTLLLT